MEEHSNGKIEETQNEETHGNGVGTVKELFEELKAEVLHVEEAVLGEKDSSSESSSSSDEEEEKTEPVEEVTEPVLDPVEVVLPDMTQEVQIPVEDDSKDTNAVVQEVEEPKEKAIELESEDVVEEAIELESEDVVEKEGIDQIALTSEETEVTPTSDGNMGETSEVADKKASEEDDDSLQPAADVPAPAVDNGNKAEISTDNTRTSPIISITSRTIQPTSWRSCCGLFEVLRRNK